MKIKNIILATLLTVIIMPASAKTVDKIYSGKELDHIDYPIGGLGSGMFCISGTGAITNLSFHHYPQLFHEPCAFAAVHVKGIENGAKVLETSVPDYKIFGRNATVETKSAQPERLRAVTLIFRFPAGFGTLCFRTGCRASQGLSPQPLLISRYSVVFREISYHLFVRLSRRVSLFLDISTKLIRISPRSTGSFPKQVSAGVGPCCRRQ